LALCLAQHDLDAFELPWDRESTREVATKIVHLEVIVECIRGAANRVVNQPVLQRRDALADQIELDAEDTEV
jgi:hypothetical protein